MLPPGARVIVAVSGGADSVCLLHVLKELFPDALAGIAHFNHHWRAEASDADECFVSQLAMAFDLPFFRADAAPQKGNREQEARRQRRQFFATLNAPIALGHTRDDQAETVLFRFLRGSGLAGLAAIPSVAEQIIRPLIDITRSEVEQYLRTRHIPWREDSTNQDPSYARNRIRHQLLPQLTRDWNPNLTETLARLADLAQEEENYWQSALPELTKTPDGVEVRVQASLPKALARRLFRQAILLAKGDLRQIEFSHIEAICTLKRTLHLPGVTVTRSFDWLNFSAGPPSPLLATEITRSGTYPSPGGRSEICVDFTQEPSPNACATLNMEACWLQSFSPLVLRGWRPGDHYRPAGHSRDHKVQEMFQKARVPSWRRASWPILTSGDEILWSRQFGVAQEFALAGAGRSSVRIRELS